MQSPGSGLRSRGGRVCDVISVSDFLEKVYFVDNAPWSVRPRHAFPRVLLARRSFLRLARSAQRLDKPVKIVEWLVEKDV